MYLRWCPFVSASLLCLACSKSGEDDITPFDDLGFVARDALVSTDGGAMDAGTLFEDAAPVMDGAAPMDASAPDAGFVDTGADAGDPCAEPYPLASAPPAPPYRGTLFIDPDIITVSDPTSFVSLSYQGQGLRLMYDRRSASFSDVNAHLFEARFGSSTQVEIQVNPEMNQTEAELEAIKYAEVIGRLPAFLFRDLRTVWIHRGLQPFGGGNQNLLIHTEQGIEYEQAGLLEETFLHEAAHTSMDSHHAATTRWLEAQVADGTFLSTYAEDNPTREDVAETLGPYLALRFRRSRIDPAMAQTISETVPSRIRYFDCLGLSMDTVP